MTNWDVVVIGGGPAGAVCSARLAANGRRVLLLEHAVFPREHVGESLSPSAWKLFEALGLSASLREAGFADKTGATFIWGADTDPWSVGYGDEDAPALTAHVRREDLDRLLLEHAEKSGVTVRHGCRATTVEFVEERLRRIGYTDGEGRHRWVSAHWFVDASGREAFLGRRLGLMEFDRRLRHQVTWSRWTGAGRLPGKPGNGLLIGDGESCYWAYAVDRDASTTSVGVLSRSEAGSAESAAARYLQAVKSSDVLWPLLAEAERITEVRSTEALAYYCSPVAGPGWLLAGDSAWFADSLLTPGVQLAAQQGVTAATVIDTLLDSGDVEAGALAFYDNECRRSYETFVRLAHNMYSALDNASQLPAGTSDAPAGTGSGAPPGPDLVGAMSFLTLISGLPRAELMRAMGSHMVSRAKALRRVGSAPGPSEQEGFGLLTRRFHQELLAVARDRRTAADLVDGSVIRTCPGVEIGAELFLPNAGDRRLSSRRAVRNRFGDRFEASPLLEALITRTRDGCELGRLVSELQADGGVGGAEEWGDFRSWLRILADNGLIEWQRWRTD